MNKSVTLAFLLTALFSLGPKCDAKGWGQTTIEDGGGEAIVVKHGFFGNKSTYVQDRLGDKYVNKHGLFGTKDQGVSFLGSTYENKKGPLGGSDIEASTILGDRMQSKKSLFTLGKRTTNVDLSGTNALVGQIFAHMTTKAPSATYGRTEPGLVNPNAFQSTAGMALPEAGPSQVPPQVPLPVPLQVPPLGASQSPGQTAGNDSTF